MFAMFRKPKTFKLRALHSHKKFGVAGKSCQEVLRKGCHHLQVVLGPAVRGRIGGCVPGLWVGWDSAEPSSFTISPGGAPCVRVS